MWHAENHVIFTFSSHVLFTSLRSQNAAAALGTARAPAAAFWERQNVLKTQRNQCDWRHATSPFTNVFTFCLISRNPCNPLQWASTLAAPDQVYWCLVVLRICCVFWYNWGIRPTKSGFDTWIGIGNIAGNLSRVVPEAGNHRFGPKQKNTQQKQKQLVLRCGWTL